MDSIAAVPGFADFVLRPTGVLLLAGALVLVMRRASAASRHAVWSAALCAVLVLPLLGPLTPEVRVPIGGPVAGLLERVLDAAPGALGEEGSAPEQTGRGAGAEPAGPGGTPAGVEADPVGLGPDPAGAPVPWRGIWLAGFLGFAAVLGLRLATLRRLERTARPATVPALLAALEEAKDRLRIDRPVRLLLGEPAAMPMTWGHGTPRILLPASAADWPSEQTRAVLLHELAHVGRGDVLLQRVGELARAVLWFHPLAWYAARRMLAEREHACDDAVIRAGVRGPEYAHQLLAMTHSLRAARGVAAALPMARRSQMTGRLMAILDEGRSRRASPPSGARLVLALGLAAGVAAGALLPVPLGAAAGGPASVPEQNSAMTAQDADPSAPSAPVLTALSDCWASAGRDTHTNRNEDPALVTAEWRTPRCEGGLRITGRAVLTSDFSGFARLEPGTRVKIGERKRGGEWLKLLLVGGADGRILRGGTFGDRVVEPAEVDRWLEANLRPLLRLTGVRLEVDERSP